MDQSHVGDAFREEATDHLETLTSEIISLERNPSNREAIRRMFIAAHSLKAGGALVGSEPVRDLAHAMEDVLAVIRERPRAYGPEVADALLASVDALRTLVITPEPADGSAARIGELIGELQTLARQLAEENRGPLPQRWGRGRGEGQFSPTAPVPGARATKSAHASRVDRRSRHSRRALIVDDSPTVRLLETIVLRDEGFAVDALDDTAVALQQLLQDQYDLVVAGMETRGLGGLDFVAALREQPEIQSLPVIVTDTEDDPMQRQRAAELGVMDYVRIAAHWDRLLAHAVRKAIASHD